MTDLRQLFEAVVTGDHVTSKSITTEAIAAGVEPLSLVNDHMIPAMDDVGAKFERNEYFVPELLLSARAMKSAMELIRPLLAWRAPVSRCRCSRSTPRKPRPVRRS